ncbi:hypothetical protein BC834DRAFT_874437 [Gloeopeniophorella convolvens]|nr:hypothetical protein BC834DRAFT_874437 [Gloeopeniophorella convolvens]
MAPEPFSLRIQHGITGGIVAPRPSAVHDFSLEAANAPHILLISQQRPDGTPQLLDPEPRKVATSDETTALVKELEGILRKLPTEQLPSTDIYQRDIGIFWQGSDGFTWANSAPQGCGGFQSDVVVTEEDRKAFNRAVEITGILVERGAAHEG